MVISGIRGRWRAGVQAKFQGLYCRYELKESEEWADNVLIGIKRVTALD